MGGRNSTTSACEKHTPGISIDMPGHMSAERPVGGWPNLVDITRLAHERVAALETLAPPTLELTPS